MTARAASAATAVYLAVTIYATWPLADLSADYIFPRGSPDDILLVLWILAWDVHALATDPARLFDGNILYPARHVLAHSEHLLGTLPLFAPAMTITGDPVPALNVMMLGSFVLGGLFMHMLLWSWTGSTLAAYVGGLCFALAPWRINGLNWPHLLSTQYIPLTVLGIETVVATQRARAAAILAVALGLQLLTSYYLAYMVAIVAAIFVAKCLFADRASTTPKTLVTLTIGIAIPLVVFIGVSFRYLDLYGSGEFHRPNVNAKMLEVLGSFGGPVFVMQTFVGWEATALALLALAIRTRESQARVWALIFLLVFALAICPGPAGFFDGTLSVYSWLEAFVPGFSLIRVPFRFGILASFAVAALAGLGAAWAAARLRKAPKPALYLFAAATLCLAVVAGLQAAVARPLTLPNRQNLPPVYAWLAANGNGGPLLELPLQEPRALSAWQWDRAGARAMYYSVYHWLPLLNGYTGYMPPVTTAVEELASRLPDDEALEALRACTGLRWILVHRLGGAREQAWRSLRGIRFVARFSAPGHDDTLFEVLATRSSVCTDPRFTAQVSKGIGRIMSQPAESGSYGASDYATRRRPTPGRNRPVPAA